MGGLLHSLRHPRRCYLVCAIARSGSNMLTDGLHSTRLAGRPKQFFLSKFEEEFRAKHHLENVTDFAAYVHGIIRETSTSNEVFGFKVMGWYLEAFLDRLRQAEIFGGPPELDMLRRAFPRLRFVQMLRRNKLRQAVSKAKALQSGLWKIQDGNQAVSEPRFDADLITQCLEDTRTDERVWNQFFERNAIRPCLVEYEDLCQDFEGAIRRVLDFLKIRLPRGTPIAPPQTIRQTDSLSRDWEARYLELHPSARQFATA